MDTPLLNLPVPKYTQTISTKETKQPLHKKRKYLDSFFTKTFKNKYFRLYIDASKIHKKKEH